MANTAKKHGSDDIKSSLDRFKKTAAWKELESLLSVARADEQYHRQLEVMEYLMLNTPDSADNPFNWFMDALANAIEAYEENRYPIREAEPREVLAYLMEEHDLTQNDLPEVGSQGVVSEILRGKRELNLRQIKSLASRFHLSPLVFMGQVL